MKRFVAAALSAALSVALVTSSYAASVGGTVSAAQGGSLGAMQVIIKDASGKVIGSATTGANGVYDINNVPPGNYQVTLDPGSTGFQGQTLASYVTNDGLCLNWGVSSQSPAIGTAAPGSVCDDPPDYAPYVGGAAALLAAGAIAAVAVNIGPDNHSKKTPTSTQ